ncbi:MAG: hypothetical protein LBD67_10525 [Candidatus Accumulibacter sp.]|jgi:hypothetical protein|nr:hypothetical protein [Accumulibacter sp.]
MNNDISDTANADTLYISNLLEGESILDNLPFDEPQQAEKILNRFFDALLNPLLNNETIYALLEKAAESVAFVTSELAKDYLGQPLTLSESQETSFRSVNMLWKKMADAYAYCIDSGGRIDFQDNVRNHAGILYRCIHYTGLSILEYQRARQEYAPPLLYTLNSYYARAEKAGIDSLIINHPFEPETKTCCAAPYIVICLCDMVDRHRLSASEQTLVLRWGILWAPLITLHKISANNALPPFVLDLTQDRLFFPSDGNNWNESLRRMETARLLSRLRRVEEQLRQQVSPLDLDLGPHCTIGQCLNLLKRLSRSWSQSKTSRKFRRLFFSRFQPIQLCTGFEEIFFHVSGTPFEQTRKEKRLYSSDNFEMQFIFRADPTEQDFQVRVGSERNRLAPDSWKLMDESLTGLRLVTEASKKKITLDQLVAVTPPGETAFVLGQVVWALQNKERGLTAGIQLFAGKPLAVAVRFLGNAPNKANIYYPGFLLDACASLEEEKSLLLPVRLYRPNARVEFAREDGTVFGQAVLRRIVESGCDFDRISYSV